MIVEGLYIFMREHGMNDLMDFKIYIDCAEDTVINRLVPRHVASGICENTQ